MVEEWPGFTKWAQRHASNRFTQREYNALHAAGIVGFLVSAPGEDALDGMKVDQQGSLYVSGPGGVWILSATGKHLGTIIAPKHPHNMAWGTRTARRSIFAPKAGAIARA